MLLTYKLDGQRDIADLRFYGEIADTRWNCGYRTSSSGRQLAATIRLVQTSYLAAATKVICHIYIRIITRI